jgi:predicted ATPase
MLADITSIIPWTTSALHTILGYLDSAYRYGQLAIEMLERLDNKAQEARTIFFAVTFTAYWKDDIFDHMPEMRRARDTSWISKWSFSWRRTLWDAQCSSDRHFIF